MASGGNDDDELAYLQPGFDSSSLKVAQLRNVLLTHGVSYPSSAKKSELVDIFNFGLKPKAKQILSELRRIQRSSTGIEDATSSIENTQDKNDKKGDLEAPVTTNSGRSRGRARKSIAPVPENQLDDTITPSSHTSRRRTTAAVKRPSSSTARERNSPRRATTIVPMVKPKEKDFEPLLSEVDVNPFSSDNPFQSGSSPAIEFTSPVLVTARPSTSQSLSKPLCRKIAFTPSQTQTRKAAIDFPISVVQNDDGSVVGEDFVPEERMALEKARRHGTALVPVRRQSRKQHGSGQVKNFLSASFLVATCTLAALYTQEKFQVGYCGVGQPSVRIAGAEIPTWADGLRPYCEECPRHARCYENMGTTCEVNFVLKHHPLSLRGLLPFPPTCEPDSEREKRIKSVANHITHILREAAARAECEGTASAEVSEQQLRDEISSKIKKGIPPDEVDNLLTQAFADVEGREEMVVTTDENTSEWKFRSTSLGYISISCTARRYLRRTVEQYTRQALILLTLLALAMIPIVQIRDSRVAKREAKHLASRVFESLADHAADLMHNPSSHRTGYLNVNQLRDDVLRNEFSSAKRKKLWTQVEKLIEQNSNVRSRVGTIDTGDVARGWKWIGAVKTLEDGATDSRLQNRRQTGRYSFPAMTCSSPNLSEDGAHTNVTPKREADDTFTRWENTNRPTF